MITIIVFLLTAFGLTNILVREKISEKPRNFFEKYFKYSFVNKMLKCETCTGFWVGMGLFWMITPPSPFIWVNILICGFMASGFIKMITITLYKF